MVGWSRVDEDVIDEEDKEDKECVEVDESDKELFDGSDEEYEDEFWVCWKREVLL